MNEMNNNLLLLKDMKILKDKKIFIRCDFNTPIDEFQNITDDRRIRAAIPTIRYCLDAGCAVILASHFGRPKNGYDEKYSLLPVAKRLSRRMNREIIFAHDVTGSDAKNKVENLKSGGVMLLENLRFENGETKNDPEFARILSSYVDYYVNDAFGVCHRAHASVDAITSFFNETNKSAGFLLQKEIEYAKNLIKKPIRPFVAVVGGSKVSGKLEALTNLLTKVDKLIIGGGMAFTFLKSLGIDIGKSLLEPDLVDEARKILEKGKKLGVKIYLPIDVVAADKISQDANSKFVTTLEIPKDWMGLDIGPASIRLFKEALEDAQTIWWNGPMGVFEIDKFNRGSIKISHAIAESQATTVIGGGDTADVIERAGDGDEMSFISTGGGASLELIEGKELPGVVALYKRD